ncbi:MAG: hypothetical protein ACF8LK_10430, partial [Phycisphaerales bacterium JB041]
MSMRTRLAATGIAAILCCVPAAAQQSDFVYQGRLLDDGAPVNQRVDAVFSLWSAATGGIRVGQPIALNGLTVTDGLLTASLDFGPDMYNDERWLEISINRITLSPRQPISAAPKAIRLEGVSNDGLGNFGVNTGSPEARWHVFEDGAPAIRAEGTGTSSLVATNTALSAPAIFGLAENSSGVGITGQVGTTSSSGDGIGVWGRSYGATGAGVVGDSLYFGPGYSFGVSGSTRSTGNGSAGVRGLATESTGATYGGSFGNYSEEFGSAAVLAESYASTGFTAGIRAEVDSPDGTAVYGVADNFGGGIAVRGDSSSNGFAGYFFGRLHASGHTSVGRPGVRISNSEFFGVHTNASGGGYGGMYVSG